MYSSVDAWGHTHLVPKTVHTQPDQQNSLRKINSFSPPYSSKPTKMGPARLISKGTRVREGHSRL